MSDAKLSRGALVALVVGSMVGAGIFTLPAARSFCCSQRCSVRAGHLAVCRGAARAAPALVQRARPAAFSAAVRGRMVALVALPTGALTI
jgi:hypothetical protein